MFIWQLRANIVNFQWNYLQRTLLYRIIMKVKSLLKKRCLTITKFSYILPLQTLEFNVADCTNGPNSSSLHTARTFAMRLQFYNNVYFPAPWPQAQPCDLPISEVCQRSYLLLWDSVIIKEVSRLACILNKKIKDTWSRAFPDKMP